MNVGQKVRVRPGSGLARYWNIHQDALGTITCRYRVLKASQVAPERIDVRFDSKLVVWGASEQEFEPLKENL